MTNEKINETIFDLTVFKTDIENKLKEEFNLFGNDNFQTMNYTKLFNIISKHLLLTNGEKFVNSENELRCLTLKNLNDQMETIKENLKKNSAIVGTLKIELLTICSNYNWTNNIIKKFRESVSDSSGQSDSSDQSDSSSLTTNQIVVPTQNPPIELSQFIKDKINSLIESFKLVQSNGVYLSFNNIAEQPKLKPQLQTSDNDVENFTQIFTKFSEYKILFDNKKSNLLNAIYKYFELLMVQKCLLVLIDLRKLQCPEEAELYN